MYRLGVAACLATLLGCAVPSGDRSTSLAAEGNGFSITLDALDEQVRDVLFEERTGGKPTEVYELRAEVLDGMIEDRVLADEAARRGISVDALVEAEAAPVTDEEVAKFFEENRASFPERFELADISDRLRGFLEEERRHAAVRSLVEQAGVTVHLEPPRIDVGAEGPARGPEDAPVTIVEFSDFQCPFCRRAGPIVEEVLRRHPDDVRLVYRHLPLESIHPRARPAAEASACADDQGRFWEFHDRIFASQDTLGDADLRGHAEALGLDLAAYDACVADRAHEATVAADLEAAREAGISSTPTFLVNGVLIKGARPVEAFEEAIQRELRTRTAAP